MNFLVKTLLQKKQIEDHSRGKYGFFGLLWTGSRKTAFSHWMIMAIALVPLLLVQQVAQSMIEGIATRIIETDSYHLLFRPYKNELLVEKTVRDVYKDKFKNVEGVTGAYSELRGIGIIKNGNLKTGINIRGIDAELLEDEGFKKYIQVVEGTFDISDPQHVVLGKAIATKIKASIGDSIMILTARAGEGQGKLPRISRLTIAGIVSTGYEELDKVWVFTHIDKAISLIPPDDRYWYIGMKIEDPFSISNGLITRSKQITAEGNAIHHRTKNEILKDGYLSTWYSNNFGKYSLFIDTKNILSMVMFIAVLLAAVTLSSTMSMQVVDMEIDIAMLKGMGANPKRLEQQIFLQGLRYGIIGSLLGCAIGFILTAQVNNIIFAIDAVINGLRYIFGYTNHISILNPEYYLTKIPFRFYPKDMLIVAVNAIILSVLAAWIPARRLRKITPLKLIRLH